MNVITLGCSKNLVDSEVMITQLRGNDIDVEHESGKDDANIVIINTCGFIDSAKQESVDTILRFADAKDNGWIDKLYVSGCLSERYKEDLIKEFPQVDAFFGTREVPALLKKFNADYKHELLGERAITTSHYAFLKIAEGCDRPCSFCAIPLIRGKHISVPMEELVKQAENLVKNGVKELILIAQDLTYYGLDLYGKRTLAELMRRLSDVEGVEWIRLHYAFPSGFPMDVIEVMKERDNICNYLDIPLQHGSSNVLKLMRRGIDREKTEALINRVREQIPGIAIRTTLIAGHPGETEEDHLETLQFIKDMRFERLGVFTYSHEENTHAYTMEDDVPEEEKERRMEEIMQLQADISYNLNQEKVGQTYKVLIDRMESGYFYGRTEFDSVEVDNEVLIDASQHYLRIGDFVEVTIDDATEFDLYGTPAALNEIHESL
ncbi:MAG: 30S ribosomal protein S12 methylthiotransferase RimO [Cytophagales bacterium]|nr:30S ribosomal protein S12 methylthiotransferase RimO [Cytophagales bacterium]